MRFALNIGLNTSDKYTAPHPKTISGLEVCAVVNAMGFHIAARRDTKATATEEGTVALIVMCNPMSRYAPRQRIYDIAEELWQDCISVVPIEFKVREIGKGYRPEPQWEAGALVGPFAKDWGKFDRALFKPFEVW